MRDSTLKESPFPAGRAPRLMHTMHTTLRHAVLALALAAAGCPTTSEEPQPDPTGLPEGESTWSGTVEIDGNEFLLDVTLDNDGGLLGATVTFDETEDTAGFGSGTMTAQGTHHPGSGLLALSPIGWVEEPNVTPELPGVTATYDHSTGTITGTAVDYTTPEDNVLRGGALLLTLESGDGAPLAVGDEARSLAEGDNDFAGTFQCTGPVRETEGTLTYDGEGALSGELTVGDPDLDTPLGTFDVSGVHNPTSGGITLVPGVWTSGAHNTLSFFVSGSYDPDTGAFDGDQGTTIAACPPGQWSVAF